MKETHTSDNICELGTSQQTCFTDGVPVLPLLEELPPQKQRLCPVPMKPFWLIELTSLLSLPPIAQTWRTVLLL